MELKRRSQNPTIVIDDPEPQPNIQQMYKEMPLKVVGALKRLPLVAKIALVVTLLLSVYFYTSFMRTLFTNHLERESFLEVSTCPACYGKSACPMFLSGEYTFDGLSKIRYLDFLNTKNVHVTMSGTKKMVLKKLGHNSELEKLDAFICGNAGYDSNCDSRKAIYQTKPALEREMNPGVLKGLSPALHCPSQRLVDRIVAYYEEKQNPHEFQFEDRLPLITTAMINVEPIIMQTFPADEGYPFPKYIGSCGRFVAVEHVGRTLHHYYHATWEERIDFAYQLILIADLLTETKLGFAFYLTDVTYDNFAVNRDGKVVIVDLEDILIVDKAKIRREKLGEWNKPLYSKFTPCEKGETDCTSYSPDDLCSRETTDHNYYMICRNLLSRESGDPLHPRGLLHDIPDSVGGKQNLETLVQECANPLLPSGRLKVKEQLHDALQEIRNDYL